MNGIICNEVIIDVFAVTSDLSNWSVIRSADYRKYFRVAGFDFYLLALTIIVAF